jgi:hypothetical protein
MFPFFNFDFLFPEIQAWPNAWLDVYGVNFCGGELNVNKNYEKC